MLTGKDLGDPVYDLLRIIIINNRVILRVVNEDTLFDRVLQKEQKKNSSKTHLI